MRDYPPPERDIGADPTPWFVWVGSIVGLVLMAGSVVVMFDVLSNRTDRAFIAKCIEFNSIDRCRDLFEFGRQDLGLRPSKAIQ